MHEGEGGGDDWWAVDLLLHCVVARQLTTSDPAVCFIPTCSGARRYAAWPRAASTRQSRKKPKPKTTLCTRRRLITFTAGEQASASAGCSKQQELALCSSSLPFRLIANLLHLRLHLAPFQDAFLREPGEQQDPEHLYQHWGAVRRWGVYFDLPPALLPVPTTSALSLPCLQHILW